MKSITEQDSKVPASVKYFVSKVVKIVLIVGLSFSIKYLLKKSGNLPRNSVFELAAATFLVEAVDSVCKSNQDNANQQQTTELAQRNAELVEENQGLHEANRDLHHQLDQRDITNTAAQLPVVSSTSSETILNALENESGRENKRLNECIARLEEEKSKLQTVVRKQRQTNYSVATMTRDNKLLSESDDDTVTTESVVREPGVR